MGSGRTTFLQSRLALVGGSALRQSCFGLPGASSLLILHCTWHPAHVCAAGYRSAVLTDNLGSCPFAHPFKTDCSATAGRTVAFETDASCLVRVYVLGDPSCSQTDNMTIVDG